MHPSHPAPTRQLLEFQADRIESVLASHRVPVRVDGGAVTPRWIRFNLVPGLGARITRVQDLSEELALALGAEDVRVERRGDHLSLEVARLDAEPISLLPLLESLPGLPRLTAAMGVAEDGRPLLIRISSPDVAHILVAGATGSGKTELMRAILLSLALTNRQSRLQMALIDPKARSFVPLSDLPHLIGETAVTPPAVVELLRRLVAEMERRDAMGISTPHIVIAVDELLDLFSTTIGAKVAAPLLTRIAARGREAGLHLLVGVQRPGAQDIGPLLKANFPVRLVGRVSSPEDARVAAGVAGSKAEKLAGRGDFLAVACGEITHFQAAYVPVYEWPRVKQALSNHRKPGQIMTSSLPKGAAP